MVPNEDVFDPLAFAERARAGLCSWRSQGPVSGGNQTALDEGLQRKDFLPKSTVANVSRRPSRLARRSHGVVSTMVMMFGPG
jgi:hypothetical protein